MKAVSSLLMLVAIIFSLQPASAEVAGPITERASALIQSNERAITLLLLTRRNPNSLTSVKTWEKHLGDLGIRIDAVSEEQVCFHLFKVSGSPAGFKAVIALSDGQLAREGGKTPFYNAIHWIGVDAKEANVAEIARRGCSGY